MGHSSGAQFIASMLANHRAELNFAGVVPVSSNRVGTWSPVPAMLIHGLMDSERPNDPSGAIDITQYTESNQCSGGTTPVNVPSCTSLAQGATVNPGCVQYNGCAAPTFFCNHNDPNYIDAARNNLATNHGWPCFANDRILQFFESLR
jgi:poly(3-hydroxybutyrate) depolymerase